jgi:hypothetical protein
MSPPVPIKCYQMRSFNNHVLPAVLVSVLVAVLVATVYIWQRPTFVTSPTPTTSNPTVKILGDNDISVSALRLTGFDGCDSLQTEAILSGLSEAGRMLSGLYIRRSELFNFQEAAAMDIWAYLD